MQYSKLSRGQVKLVNLVIIRSMRGSYIMRVTVILCMWASVQCGEATITIRPRGIVTREKVRGQKCHAAKYHLTANSCSIKGLFFPNS
jgi:hypothetical protein